MKTKTLLLASLISMTIGCHHRNLNTSSQLQGLSTVAERSETDWAVFLKLPLLAKGDKWIIKFKNEEIPFTMTDSDKYTIVKWNASNERFASRKPFKVNLVSTSLNVDAVIDIPPHPLNSLGVSLFSSIVFHH